MRRSALVLVLALSLLGATGSVALAEPVDPPGPWTDTPSLLCILGYHLPQHPHFGWYMERCVPDDRGP